MKSLRCGLIGDHIGETLFPAALQLMCQKAGIELSFELIDTAGKSGFDFAPFVDGLRADNWHGCAVTRTDEAYTADDA